MEKIKKDWNWKEKYLDISKKSRFLFSKLKDLKDSNDSNDSKTVRVFRILFRLQGIFIYQYNRPLFPCSFLIINGEPNIPEILNSMHKPIKPSKSNENGNENENLVMEKRDIMQEWISSVMLVYVDEIESPIKNIENIKNDANNNNGKINNDEICNLMKSTELKKMNEFISIDEENTKVQRGMLHQQLELLPDWLFSNEDFVESETFD